MKIPFHGIREWKVMSQRILRSFLGNKNRNELANVIHSYNSYPDEIVNVCEYILKNWKREIIIPIPTGLFKQRSITKRRPHFGDHIKEALGHPNLKSLATRTAREIIKERQQKAINVPDYLFEISKKIIDANIYPEWNAKIVKQSIPE
jgi:hypothetical protein